jgi:hypothetical protein
MFPENTLIRSTTKITLHNNYNSCTIKKTHLSRYGFFPSYADACLNQQFHTVLSLSLCRFLLRVRPTTHYWPLTWNPAVNPYLLRQTPQTLPERVRGWGDGEGGGHWRVGWNNIFFSALSFVNKKARKCYVAVIKNTFSLPKREFLRSPQES